MSKKSVLLVVPALGIGGQERIAVNTAIALLDQYDVKIAVFENKEVKYDSPCEVINLELPPKRGLVSKVLNTFKRILKLSKIRRMCHSDIVMSLGNSANLVNALSSIISPGKSICAIHGFAEVKKTLPMRIIMSLSDKVICIAKSMQDSLLSLFKNNSKTVLIENGYDINSIVEMSTNNQDVEISKNALISVGRLDKVKGFDRLIKAFAIVRQTKDDLQLVIIGKGDLREELIALVKSEGVEDCVRFLGYKKNPYAYMRQSGIYVLSSRNEGFPNALIEALACELPIISIDCQSGPREILSSEYSSERIKGISEEQYGVLVEECESDERNAELLANAILSLVNNPEKMQEYRSRGRSRAYQFSNEVYCRKLTELIESL